MPGRRAKSRPAQGQVRSDKVLQGFNTWAFKREQPDNPQLMLEFISEAVERGEPVPFVLYWGKGPRCRLDEPDTTCLDYLATLARRVRVAYPDGAAMTLIFTDTHAELNGHPKQSADEYFAAVETGARTRGFATCRLGNLVRAAEGAAANAAADEPLPEDTLRRLGTCAAKWYRGDAAPEQAALTYFRMNMVEKRAVEIAFPRSIFVTFNGSEFRCLFPERLPIFYMYSLRRGVSVKPWFLPTGRSARARKLIVHLSLAQAATILMAEYRLLPAGDTALVVEFGDQIDRELNAWVLALDRRLKEARIDGVIESVPTFRSLLVHYDPLLLPAAALTARIGDLMQDLRITRGVGPRMAPAGLLRRNARARSRRRCGPHRSDAGAGDRAAQRRHLSRLHARLPAGPGLHGRPAGGARSAAARDPAPADSGRLAGDRHHDDLHLPDGDALRMASHRAIAGAPVGARRWARTRCSRPATR